MNGSSKLMDLASLMDSEEPSYSTEIRNREVRSLIYSQTERWYS